MTPERRSSPVELFWDLVFVFAVTQVTTLLRHDLTWAGFGRAMLILALVWWAWSAYVWVMNAQDPESPPVRVALLAAAGLIFIAGLAVPEAFRGEGTLFAVTYVCVRVAHLALYADASRRGNANWAAIAAFGVTIAIGMGLLLAGSFVHGGWRVALWTAAAAIDYAGPAWLTRESLRGLQEVAVEHFAERYGLFVIICLGESVVAIGVGAQGRPLGAALLAAVGLTLLITAELWWAYFTRFAAIAQQSLAAARDPVLAAADGYSYLHLLLVAGVIVFAVGAREEVAHAAAPLAGPARLALCGGLGIYLLGGVAFRLRMVGTVGWMKIAAAGACLAVYAVSAHAAAWVTAAVLAGLLAALLAWEQWRGALAAPADRALGA
ncbi:MAG TPA: low temperature requirement protein A [Solirubrobacteraceae bacterium]|nr:low temperature requirement protein A [Solirubrobacteraceae bacterium]